MATYNLFSAALPTLQIAWDSTSLGELKSCPKRYWYKYIRQRQTLGSSIHLTFGGAYHKALEIYDHKKSEGMDHEEAQLEAVAYCLTFPDDPETRDDKKNRESLTRTVSWYLDHFADDSAETLILANGKPAVELSFRIELDAIHSRTPEGDPFFLCGHLDRVVSFQGHIYYLDRKTTGGSLSQSFFAAFSPNNQMSLYDFASSVIIPNQIAGGIIDAAQIGATFSRFARHIIHRSPDQREEFLQNTEYYINLARFYSENNYWPMNDKACSDYGGCAYQGPCSRPESLREIYLSDPSRFTDGLWNPLEVRGDI